jgi:hypothetical protein
VVESQPSKLLVAGSIPVSRSIRLSANEPTRYGVMARRSGPDAKADVAQLAERVLGKDEVTSSILVIGSSSARDAGGGGRPGARSERRGPQSG